MSGEGDSVECHNRKQDMAHFARNIPTLRRRKQPTEPQIKWHLSVAFVFVFEISRLLRGELILVHMRAVLIISLETEEL